MSGCGYFWIGVYY